ncbi:MAG: KpsF/GutQ family sugar-phosphate isomerase [Planctomycetota bacterium]|nr:MAG: KpsF/GutQ family sugar-phosphate isomerase [Planctomycetota bacterium]REJ87937.1 MAG: KpsF/GutQ family sugar-phosphate isomerase [Planctomycetota bacterium]REK23233.1 MAG: KpsF/GutQ family sugar-phosphate isomerase [Planctomycetota bacterium]REK30848.1 MAG: KpsF/GutQ family sugar-phosphate isomerase [Planctomycetota bacterium]
MSAAESLVHHTPFEQLRSGREIVRQEADALYSVAQRLDAAFCTAVDLIVDCKGRAVVTGMGKAGLIGQKIAATLSSTGTRSHFLHPAEGVHGDLGCLHSSDVLIALSNSGETEEICTILPTVARLQVPIIAVTSTDRNRLAAQSDVTIQLGRLQEACPWGLAPSTSTTAMLAVGDALALVASRIKGFTPEQFAVFHPAGSLGKKLRTVTETMRPRDQIRVASAGLTVREVFTTFASERRRSGAVLLVDDGGRLTGLFTDSDLARLLEKRRDDALDQPIKNVMTRSPLTVPPTATFADVVGLLSGRKLSEIPVVADDGSPVGLIDITDVIGWMPSQPGD